MNAPVPNPGPVRPTQAAEGLPRRAFTVEEIERMVECGLLSEDDRLELIGGELVVMPAKGIRHEVVKRLLFRAWRNTPEPAPDLLFETTLRLDDDTYLEPDLLVIPSTVRLSELTAPAILLAVEVADSSLGYDLYRKPPLYARFGVAELWVIDAVRRETHVFSGPGQGGYARLSVHPGSDRLVPLLAPDLPLRLDDLGVDWDTGNPA